MAEPLAGRSQPAINLPLHAPDLVLVEPPTNHTSAHVFLAWLGPLGRSLLESNQVTAPVDRALPFRHELTQLSQLAFEGWPEYRLTFGVGPAAGDDPNHLGWVMMRISLQEVAHRPLCLSHGLAVQIQFGFCDLVAELVSQFGIIPLEQPRSAFSHRLT